MVQYQQQSNLFTPERLYYVIKSANYYHDNRTLNWQLRTMSGKTDIDKTLYAQKYIASDKWGKQLNNATVLLLSHCFGKTLTPGLLQQFIADGADVNAICDNGQPVLIRTMLNFNGKLCDTLVEILLKNGAKTQCGDWNSLFVAREISTLNLLLSYGAKIDNKSNTCFWMTQPRDTAVVRWLINNGILKHKTIRIDVSAYFAKFDIETAKLWLDSGLFNQANKDNISCAIFDDATFTGRIDIIKLLLEYNFDVHECCDLTTIFSNIDSYKAIADNNTLINDNNYTPVFDDIPQNIEILNATEILGDDLNTIIKSHSFFDLNILEILVMHGAKFSKKSPLVRLLCDTELQQLVVDRLKRY